MSAEPKTLPRPEEMTASQMGEAISTAWSQFINTDSRPMSKRNNVYASSYKECDRQMVLDMTHGDTLPAFDADTLARFRRGNDRERDMMADLKKIGRNCEPSFEVIGEQERFELKDKKGRTAITGKIDGRLQISQHNKYLFLHGQRSIPVEAKAWNPNLVAKIQTFEDLFKSRWTRGGAYQLLSYIFAMDVPLGFLLLDRSGLPALIPVELYPNLERVEKFLAKSEVAMNHKEAGTLPDFIKDKEECKFCPHFGRNCNPPMTYGEGAQVFTDPEVIQKAERYNELETKLTEAGLDEYESLDKWVKKQFRGVETGIVGSLLVSGKWMKGTTYDVPVDVANLIAEKEAAIKAQLSVYAKPEPKSKFSVKLTKVV